eukprot:CAMPEP_0170188620 /NCGR_PEP_ID=MMETSP0040_2-20121228/44785_1 /TAXON_ID=641309 /ORGANISM="Lotharella oceanica, Strain CCMP622" /LENGTH=189 /DNA_ID=CAMNT_0010435955 /DNA_START=55 /DNA_END=624 /DNA_ORIENTATION=-
MILELRCVVSTAAFSHVVKTTAQELRSSLNILMARKLFERKSKKGTKTTTKEEKDSKNSKEEKEPTQNQQQPQHHQHPDGKNNNQEQKGSSSKAGGGGGGGGTNQELDKLLIARVIVKMGKILKSVLPSRIIAPLSPSSSGQGEGRPPEKPINVPPKNSTVLDKLRTIESVRRLCEIIFFPMNGSLHAM